MSGDRVYREITEIVTRKYTALKEFCCVEIGPSVTHRLNRFSRWEDCLNCITVEKNFRRASNLDDVLGDRGQPSKGNICGHEPSQKYLA